MDDLTLYILVRTDLESLGLGKACAQSSHASNKFTDDWIIAPLLEGAETAADAMAWRAQAGTFGTVLTLDVPNLPVMTQVVDAANKLGFKAALVEDPTYPYLVPNEIVGRLNPAIHTAPPRPAGKAHTACFTAEYATAYVFGSKAMLDVILARFGLLRND